MTTLINDPLAAYSDATVEGAPGAQVTEYRTATAITKGAAVALSVSSGVFTVAVAGDDDDNVIGVAQQSVTGTTALPKSIRIVTAGPAQAQTADADIEVGDWVSATTSGRYAKAVTAAIADADTKTLGFVLEATVASTDAVGDLKWIVVQPSLIAVT
jgi:hypothetical protein